MNPTRSLVLSLLVAAPATAQVSSSMFLDTDAGLYTTAGGKDDFKSAKKGTQIPPITYTWRLSNSVSVGSGATGVNAMQSIWASTNYDGNGGSMGLTGLARGKAATEYSHLTPSLTKNGTPGPVAFLLKMKHTTPGHKGAVRVTWQTLFKLTASAKATIDVGNDGKVDWSGGDTKGGMKSDDLLAAFDKNGDLPIRITLYGDLKAADPYTSSSLYGRLTFKWVDPQNSSCKVTSYGSGCAGTQAAGGVVSLGNEHVITLKVTGGFPNGSVVEAIGNQKLSLPLPGGCSLVTNALVLLIHPLDAKGEFTQIRKASKYLTSTTYHQYLPIDLQKGQLVIRASNGLQITCIGAR